MGFPIWSEKKIVSFHNRRVPRDGAKVASWEMMSVWV